MVKSWRSPAARAGFLWTGSPSRSRPTEGPPGAVYTYLIADLRGGAILDELPLSGVSFDKKLNDAGSLRAQLQVLDPVIRSRGPRLLTEPGRTAIYVDRDGTLLWGGIIWTSRYRAAEGV